MLLDILFIVLNFMIRIEQIPIYERNKNPEILENFADEIIFNVFG